MKWKAIGQSVIGESHLVTGKECEDALQYAVVTNSNNDEILICCVSDGAGSAQYAQFASEYATMKIVEELKGFASEEVDVCDAEIYSIVEGVYDGLLNKAKLEHVNLNEFSCTLLGCYLTQQKSIFFQIGDGAIVKHDNNNFYTVVIMPQNGEYQNSTTFIVDDINLGNLKIVTINEAVNEVALFTDGLQLLALNMVDKTVHQPFFNNLFKFLRQANQQDAIDILNKKLKDYLNSEAINKRTDDDKTLFLGTRLG